MFPSKVVVCNITHKIWVFGKPLEVISSNSQYTLEVGSCDWQWGHIIWFALGKEPIDTLSTWQAVMTSTRIMSTLGTNHIQHKDLYRITQTEKGMYLTSMQLAKV